MWSFTINSVLGTSVRSADQGSIAPEINSLCHLPWALKGQVVINQHEPGAGCAASRLPSNWIWSQYPMSKKALRNTRYGWMGASIELPQPSCPGRGLQSASIPTTLILPRGLTLVSTSSPYLNKGNWMMASRARNPHLGTALMFSLCNATERQ